MANKRRVSMVFLTEEGEGTDWMSVREYCNAISKETAKREILVSKKGSEVSIGRPKAGASPIEKDILLKEDKGPATPQAVYYRIKQGFLAKKEMYGKVLVREKKEKK